MKKLTVSEVLVWIVEEIKDWEQCYASLYASLYAS